MIKVHILLFMCMCAGESGNVGERREIDEKMKLNCLLSPLFSLPFTTSFHFHFLLPFPHPTALHPSSPTTQREKGESSPSTYSYTTTTNYYLERFFSFWFSSFLWSVSLLLSFWSALGYYMYIHIYIYIHIYQSLVRRIHSTSSNNHIIRSVYYVLRFMMY